jgi:hypothetical protein
MEKMAVEMKAASAKVRCSPWSRALDILFRICHIGMAGILLGGAIFKAPLPQIHLYAWLTVATGLGLVATELHHSLRWPHEGRGLFAVGHILPVGLLHIWPDGCVAWLWSALLIGGIGSHMPRNLRHWSLIYGKLKS